jgi:hypothetical protein
MEKEELVQAMEFMLKETSQLPYEVTAGVSMASLTGITLERNGQETTYDRNEVAEAMRIYHFMKISVAMNPVEND